MKELQWDIKYFYTYSPSKVNITINFMLKGE